MFVFVLF